MRVPIILLAAGALLVGCFASTPVYEGDTSGVPTNLTRIKDGKIDMGLPAGWEASAQATADHASNWAADIRQAYQKQVPGGGAVLTTTYFSMLLGKNAMANTLRDSLDPNAVKVLGPSRVDSPSMLDPEFEIYDFDAVGEGMSVPLTALIAWKLDGGIGGCKYGLLMVGPRVAKETMLNDFLAVLGSLS